MHFQYTISPVAEPVIIVESWAVIQEIGWEKCPPNINADVRPDIYDFEL
jgi:hypothetical protein